MCTSGNRKVQYTINILERQVDTLTGIIPMFNRYLEVEKAKNYQDVIGDIGVEIFVTVNDLKQLDMGITNKEI